MATKSLEAYRKEAQKAAAAQQTAYETGRKQQAARDYAAQAAVIDAKAAADTEQHRETLKQAESGYRELYDQNAVNELITRRQVEETMAGLGLSRSGGKAVGQQAATVTREKADTAVSEKRQAAVEELNRLITEIQTEAAADKAQAKSKLDAAAYKDIEAYRQKQTQQAEKQAQYNYEAALKASVSEKRTEYAMLLIRHNYSATAAWKEAYRLYPATKEEST